MLNKVLLKKEYFIVLLNYLFYYFLIIKFKVWNDPQNLQMFLFYLSLDLDGSSLKVEYKENFKLYFLEDLFFLCTENILMIVKIFLI
jgi:hypothetical protein